MNRILILTVMILALLLPMTAAAKDQDPNRTIGFVPLTADNIAARLDAQVLRAIMPSGHGRTSVGISCTVPVYLGDLKQTSPLARQMSEELARYFLEMGYHVDEIRKGNEVVVTDAQGEFLLTRDVRKLEDRNITTELIMIGTYTLTDRSVRFNIKLLHTISREIVAMAAGTVPITVELAPLVAESANIPLGPSVRTKLR